MAKLAVILALAACGGSAKAPESPPATAPAPVVAPVVAPAPAAEPSPEDKARMEAEAAVKAAAKAMARLDELDRQLAELNKRVDAAVDQITRAQNDADRTAATRTLDKLRFDKTALERDIIEAKEAAAKAQRNKGVHVSKECIDNPLAKGCS
jgi:TolA-binding protein